MCIFLIPVKLRKCILFWDSIFLDWPYSVLGGHMGDWGGGGGEETLTLENLENAGIPYVLTILCVEEL